MEISKGVWPTMITPFTENNEVDFDALDRLVEWYIQSQVDGLFAVCQSSEMFYLSLKERVEIASFVVRKAAGRVPVIASGHISDSFEDQSIELNAMAGTGIDALVLITNRLAAQDESDDVFKRNLEQLLKRIPESVALGFYECPHPYKRVISPELLNWCAQTGRFFFLKDTCCDVQTMKAKRNAVASAGLNIYNANTATLLETLKLGIAGYSGVMANFQPDLYVWLQRNWSDKPVQAENLISVLTMASWIEKQLYPVNAKYYLMLEGVLTNYHCRSKDHRLFSATDRLEVEQVHRLSKAMSKEYVI